MNRIKYSEGTSRNPYVQEESWKWYALGYPHKDYGTVWEKYYNLATEIKLAIFQSQYS